MKYKRITYKSVWVEWVEYVRDEVTGKTTRYENHNSSCTLIDSSRTQVTIAFPEGYQFRIGKQSEGLRINGVCAKKYFLNPAKHYPLKASKSLAMLKKSLMKE